MQVSASGSAVGTGGMAAKLQAAGLAASAGVPVLLTSAARAREVLDPAVEDDAAHGTVFGVTGRKISPRRLWLGYAAEPRGRLRADEGAAAAVTAGKRSLLAVGVVGVEGEFGPGEPVEIVDPAGRAIARGLAGYGAGDMARVAGLSLAQIAALLGADRAVPAVHRDELVTHAAGRRPVPG
jgi:glutamate 5-kinase